MGAFEYTAIDQGGRQRKGVLEGDTPRQIRQMLRERGLIPVSVEGVSGQVRSQGEARPRRRRDSISPTDLALVTRQLATLVRSGTVLEESLRAVSEQSEKARVKRVMAAVRSRVLEGHTLAGALGEFPNVFPELYRATVAAGEEAGHLDIILERLADYTEFRQQLRQKIMLALLYPALLTLVAVLVVVALLTYVVPQVVDVFANIGQELPLLTRSLIRVSDFLKAYGLALLIVLAFVVGTGRLLLRRESRRLRLHQLFLRLPLISKFTKALNAARFARSFSILTASGVPILEGMRVSSKVLANLAMRQAVEEAAARVREGAALHRTLAQSGYFPPLTVHLIASGEASSNLEGMLDRAAATHEREVETLIAAAMGIFEPVLILAMGGVVLLIVLAILLPIFDLNQLVR